MRPEELIVINQRYAASRRVKVLRWLENGILILVLANAVSYKSRFTNLLSRMRAEELTVIN